MQLSDYLRSLLAAAGVVTAAADDPPPPDDRPAPTSGPEPIPPRDVRHATDRRALGARKAIRRG